MNNKKGFTLVELLAVICILAVIIAIAVPSYGKVMESVQNKQYQNKISYIKTAALKYADDTNYSVFFVDDLVKNGYIEPDYNNSIIDNRDNKTIMNCYMITITETLEQNYATIEEKSYSETDGITCNINVLNSNNRAISIQIENNSESNITDSLVTNHWINTDVKLRVILNSDISSKNHRIVWYKGLEKLSETGDLISVTATDGQVIQQNYTARVEIINGDDPDGEPLNVYETSVRIGIDKVKPNFYDNDATKTNELNKDWSKNKTYNVKAYDNESGVEGYKLIKGSTVSYSDLNSFSTGKKFTISETGDYIICIKDKAGNTNCSNTFRIDSLDSSTLACSVNIENGTKGNTVSGKQWYIGGTSGNSMTISVSPNDVGPSGIMLEINDDSTKWKSSWDQTSSKYSQETYNSNPSGVKKLLNINSNSDGTKFYGHTKNAAGTIGTCNKEIYYEKDITAPTYNDSTTTSTYNTITAKFSNGSAISGIKSTKCYLTDSHGNRNLSSAVNPKSNGDCVFNIDETANSTTHYFQKCITSNAGNEKCGSGSKKNVGMCTYIDSSNLPSGWQKEEVKGSILSEGTWNNTCTCGATPAQRKRTNSYNYTIKMKKVQSGSTVASFDCGTTTKNEEETEACLQPYNNWNGTNIYETKQIYQEFIKVPSSWKNEDCDTQQKHTCYRSVCNIKIYKIAGTNNYCSKKSYSKVTTQNITKDTYNPWTASASTSCTFEDIYDSTDVANHSNSSYTEYIGRQGLWNKYDENKYQNINNNNTQTYATLLTKYCGNEDSYKNNKGKWNTDKNYYTGGIVNGIHFYCVGRYHEMVMWYTSDSTDRCTRGGLNTGDNFIRKISGKSCDIQGPGIS